MGNRVIFSADDGIHGRELWISDGTPGGTKLEVDIAPSTTYGSQVLTFIDVAGSTIFTAYSQAHGRELWKTDGTPAGTVMIKDIYPGPNSGASLVGSRMFPWKWDGTWKPIVLGKTLFFEGWTPASGGEIWETDGTPSGTVMLKDIYSGPKSGYFRGGCIVGDRVYFCARDLKGWSIWKTDGTRKGTVKVPTGSEIFWSNPFPYRGKIFFQNRDSNGAEPWVTDLTPSGTMMLKDTRPGQYSGYFKKPITMGGKVYFLAETSGYLYNLWVTDGTPAGTKRFLQSPMSDWNPVVVCGNRLFFGAMDPLHGLEPWISDGTTAGTKILKDIRPGPMGGGFGNACILGNTVFFGANDGIHGNELWKTDGTPQGTVMVKEIFPGKYGSEPQWMTPIGSRRIVFQAYGPHYGNELWVSDGTSSGTKMVADISPGQLSSLPVLFSLSEGRLFFVADDGAHGGEPWAWFPGATAKAFGFGTSDIFSFIATDPALGATMKMTVSGMGTGQAGLLLLAAPTTNPTAFGRGWLYFNPLFIYMGLVVTPAGGGSTTLAVPNDPALVGAQIASQGLVYPTSTPPIGVDFTNAVLLTFGN